MILQCSITPASLLLPLILLCFYPCLQSLSHHHFCSYSQSLSHSQFSCYSHFLLQSLPPLLIQSHSCFHCHFHFLFYNHSHFHNHRHSLSLLLFSCHSVLLTIRVVTKISSCQGNTKGTQGIKQLGISFLSMFLLFAYESSWGQIHRSRGETQAPAS